MISIAIPRNDRLKLSRLEYETEFPIIPIAFNYVACSNSSKSPYIVVVSDEGGASAQTRSSAAFSGCSSRHGRHGLCRTGARIFLLGSASAELFTTGNSKEETRVSCHVHEYFVWRAYIYYIHHNNMKKKTYM